VTACGWSLAVAEGYSRARLHRAGASDGEVGTDTNRNLEPGTSDGHRPPPPGCALWPEITSRSSLRD
jgi:hypothetical protein